MTTTLLFLALKSVMVAAITLGLLRLTRKRSAAERSTIAHLGLFALVALPLASLALPQWSIALPQMITSPIVPEPAELVAAPTKTMLPAAPDASLPRAARAQRPTAPSVTAPLAIAPSLAERAAPLVRYAYAIPAIALLMITLIALLRLVALRSRAQVLIEPHWLNALARAQHRMGFKNGTALLSSADLHSPVSWGLLRPTIVVNESALNSGEQAEAVIAHELAHVIQLDWAKLMLARVATAAFWFNPLAWVLAREAHQLREESADDAVLAANITGPDYAQLLIGIARHENRGMLMGAHGVAPGKNSLRRRVARVLDKTPARRPSGASWVAGFAAGMLTMAVPLAALTFGPAQANDEAPASPATKPSFALAPQPNSWSTKANEGPNRHANDHPLPVMDRPSARNQDHDLVDMGSAEDQDKTRGSHAEIDLNDIPAFASAWARAGAAIGEKVSAAFSRAPQPPMPPARPAPGAPAAPPAPPASNFDFNFDFDGFANKYANAKKGRTETEIAMGITDAYRADLAEAGFANLSRSELYRAKAAGLDADTIADLRSAGIDGALGNFIRARNVGLNADYINDLRKAGLGGSISDYVGARAVGLTADYAESLQDLGIKGNLREFMSAKAMGITPDYVRSLAQQGVHANMAQYRELRALGVTASYVKALHDNGMDVTDPARLVELKARGYQQKSRRRDTQ